MPISKSTYFVEDGAGHGYHLDGLDNARKMVATLRYRGLEPIIKVWDELEEKYVASESLTQEAKKWADDMHNRRMGRPSQGRSVRLQAAITPELAQWLEAQQQPSDKSISDVVFRLLSDERKRQNEFSKSPRIDGKRY